MKEKESFKKKSIFYLLKNKDKQFEVLQITEIQTKTWVIIKILGRFVKPVYVNWSLFKFENDRIWNARTVLHHLEF